MFELNDQELEQVAGGHGKLSSISSADGGGAADLGGVESVTTAGSLATHHFVTSWASNDSTAIGTNVQVLSEASSTAKSK